jgi:molybdopterin-guanine dinucleotide biosynthesis protein A
MGGQDKGLLSWRGRPLIAHLHERVRPLTDDLIISCNRNAERYAAFADHLVHDADADFPGPMAGLLAGLAHATHATLLVLPCDVPAVDHELLQAMRAAAAMQPDRPLMIRQGQFWEPLLCVIPTCQLTAFQAAWQTGERSPRQVMLQLGAQALQCPVGDVRLANLNTPDLLNP